jgi:hypothetical protein
MEDKDPRPTWGVGGVELARPYLINKLKIKGTTLMVEYKSYTLSSNPRSPQSEPYKKQEAK